MSDMKETLQTYDEISQDMNESDAFLHSSLEVSTVLLDRVIGIQEHGMDQKEAIAMESLCPALVTEDHPINSYSSIPSGVGKDYAMENIFTTVIKSIGKAIAWVFKGVWAVLSWIGDKLVNLFKGGGKAESDRVEKAVKEIEDGNAELNIENYYTKGNRLWEFLEDHHDKFQPFILEVTDVKAAIGAPMGMLIAGINRAITEANGFRENTKAREIAKVIGSNFTNVFENHADGMWGKETEKTLRVFEQMAGRYNLGVTPVRIVERTRGFRWGPITLDNYKDMRAKEEMMAKAAIVKALEDAPRQSTGGRRPDEDAMLEIMKSPLFTNSATKGQLKALQGEHDYKSAMDSAIKEVGKLDSATTITNRNAITHYKDLLKHIRVATTIVQYLAKTEHVHGVAVARIELTRQAMMKNFYENVKPVSGDDDTTGGGDRSPTDDDADS